MENKEIKISVPEGYEIDTENSTFECIKFKKKKDKLTYNRIYKELFYNKRACSPTRFSVEYYNQCDECDCNLPLNCITEIQARKIIELNKLINIATYLNDEWVPNYNDNKQIKYVIQYHYDSLEVVPVYCLCQCPICFKSEELAKKAIEIMGKENIKLAILPFLK